MYVVTTGPVSSDDDPSAILMCEATGHHFHVVQHGCDRPEQWVRWDVKAVGDE
jgi:hypothetical protein